MVGWEEHRLLVLRRKTGTLAFNQVSDEAIVAAVPLQDGPAGAIKELRFRRLLQVEKAVTGLVEGFRRRCRVLLKDPTDDIGKLGRDMFCTPYVLGWR